MYNICQLMIHFCCERDLFRLSGLHVQFMNFPHRPEDQVLPVGCPVEVGVGSENGPRFLLVVTEVLVNRGFNTCLQISDKMYRVGPYPLYKCKLPAIVTTRRRKSTR